MPTPRHASARACSKAAFVPVPSVVARPTRCGSWPSSAGQEQSARATTASTAVKGLEMTSLHRCLYALALGLVVFFLAWSAITAHPWVTPAADKRLQALAARGNCRDVTLVHQLGAGFGLRTEVS